METFSPNQCFSNQDCNHLVGHKLNSTNPNNQTINDGIDWLEEEILPPFRIWHLMFLTGAAFLGVIILLCCCFKFRIPRTKQEIEGDHIRRKILRKFRKRLKTIQNQELDDMDLKKGSSMALKGIKVVEFAGLAPAPFCGMILADFGASVIRVDRVDPTPVTDTLTRGKRSIAVDVKGNAGRSIIQRLTSKADVLIEPFRPGVMEKLKLGPDTIMRNNPRLIYARLSGYGQTGPYRGCAGHDINYVAISGLLSKLGRRNDQPTPPINLLADFAGGGLLCAFGIVTSLFERNTSGKGQVVDASMTEGAAYVGSFIFKTQHLPMWGKARGQNLLDTGAPFYDTYETKDGKWMAVGALEPQFYAQLMKGLDLDLDQFLNTEDNRKEIEAKFRTKTRDEWTQTFSTLDGCVTPVLEFDEVHKDPQNVSRDSFLLNSATGNYEPAPSPKLSRTEATVDVPIPNLEIGEHTIEILQDELNYSPEEVKDFINEALDKIREEFKSETDSNPQSEHNIVDGKSGVTSEGTGLIPNAGSAETNLDKPRKHSSSSYRRASEIAIEISLEDLRAHSRGFRGRFNRTFSRFFCGQNSKVSSTDEVKLISETVIPSSSNPSKKEDNTNKICLENEKGESEAENPMIFENNRKEMEISNKIELMKKNESTIQEKRINKPCSTINKKESRFKEEKEEMKISNDTSATKSKDEKNPKVGSSTILKVENEILTCPNPIVSTSKVKHRISSSKTAKLEKGSNSQKVMLEKEKVSEDLPSQKKEEKVVKKVNEKVYERNDDEKNKKKDVLTQKNKKGYKTEEERISAEKEEKKSKKNNK